LPILKKYFNRYIAVFLLLALLLRSWYFLKSKAEILFEEIVELRSGSIFPGPLPEPEKVTLRPNLVPWNFRREFATIVKVKDGDTVETNQGETIRYIGVDTPEIYRFNGKDWQPVWECYSFEAEIKNAEWVQGQKVFLESDQEDHDKYGRLLRYVFVKRGRHWIFVNEYLLRQGYGRYYDPKSYIPKYARLLQEAEREARLKKKGLWGACYNSRGLERTIKGDITQSGEKRYFIPSCLRYGETMVDTLSGERWFSTEREARIAGWRKARECP
jgi:micrococcal nuclease